MREPAASESASARRMQPHVRRAAALAAATAMVILGSGLLMLPFVERAAGEWQQFELAAKGDATVHRYRSTLTAAYDSVVSDYEDSLVSFEIGALPTSVLGQVLLPDRAATAQVPRQPGSSDGASSTEPIDVGSSQTTTPAPGVVADVFIRIPIIGVDQAVVEGVDRESLKKGPGHYPGTALPGSPGNVVISGHRTTYTEPFRNVDRLVAGDEILIDTPAATYRYVVEELFTVDPSDLGPLAGTTDAVLTLTTCHPAGSADERLVVVARLDVGSRIAS